MERFLYLIRARQEAGIDVTVITTIPDGISYGNPDFCRELIAGMKNNGIYVIEKDEVDEHFAIIDDELVWHGGMNLLGKEDVWDNLMRIKSVHVAAELLEIALGENTQNR